MSALPMPGINPEQYLDLDRRGERKSEYLNSEMFALSGGSLPHGVVISSLSRQLGNLLEGRRCIVTVTEVRLQVAASGFYTYPDVMVTCEPPQLLDDQKDTLLNPSVIAEVLSPSTEAYDRGGKFTHYRKIPSLREYLLVSQTEPRIERFARREDNKWEFTDSDGWDAVCLVESLGIDLSLRKIYTGVPGMEATSADAK